MPLIQLTSIFVRLTQLETFLGTLPQLVAITAQLIDLRLSLRNIQE